MKITRTSMFSGVTRTLDLPVTEEQVASWKAGTLIQQAMPELTADEREFVMTGVTAQEWSNEFGDEDDDTIHDQKGNGSQDCGSEVELLSDNELESLAGEYD